MKKEKTVAEAQRKKEREKEREVLDSRPRVCAIQFI